MKTTATAIKPQFNENGTPEIILTCPDKSILNEIPGLKSAIADGKKLDVEIKVHRNKRSLDANSYAWVLIGKIAKSMRPPIPEDEVYIEMLKRYGQREPELVSVISEGAGVIYRATKNHCTEVGESELNGKTFKHLAILIGSSQYDTKQMSVLIDGIVQDAKELGIETMTKEELDSLKGEWGGQHGKTTKRRFGLLST
jgi:hypothetical protein